MNDIVKTTVKPQNLLDQYVAYQYRYWLCLRNVDTGGEMLYSKLDTNMFTTTKHPTVIDKNTCLLYCSTTDSHFTIDSAEYTTMYTGIVGKPMQPVNYANFSMKEPYGCFFVEKIERAMNILQTSAWASARFYLKIDFVGTKAGGEIDIIPRSVVSLYSNWKYWSFS